MHLDILFYHFLRNNRWHWCLLIDNSTPKNSHLVWLWLMRMRSRHGTIGWRWTPAHVRRWSAWPKSNILLQGFVLQHMTLILGWPPWVLLMLRLSWKKFQMLINSLLSIQLTRMKVWASCCVWVHRWFWRSKSLGLILTLLRWMWRGLVRWRRIQWRIRAECMWRRRIARVRDQNWGRSVLKLQFNYYCCNFCKYVIALLQIQYSKPHLLILIRWLNLTPTRLPILNLWLFNRVHVRRLNLFDVVSMHSGSRAGHWIHALRVLIGRTSTRWVQRGQVGVVRNSAHLVPTVTIVRCAHGI